MAQYLEKFAGTIGKRQSEQILKLLNKQRNTGQIRSVQEFTQKLQNLVNELTSQELKPSLSMYMAEAEQDTDSEAFNFMLDRVEDDLSASFEEAVNIDEVQRSHEAIIRDVILKNLRAGVAELDSKITLFEFLNRDARGFDSAIFSTFRESKEERTQREGTLAQVLFRDPRRNNEVIPIAEDASVELIGERLTLATSDNSFHTIADVRQIFDSTSPQSELVVEPPGTSLRNMIDDTSGTFWVQSLLFSEPKDFVKVKLELNLGATREVNVVEIEPASRYGIILESIHYADGNNVVTSLDIPERVVESPVNIRFSKVATDRLILTFRNENSRKIQFEYNSDAEPLFAQAVTEPPLGVEPTRASITKELDEVIASAKIKDVLGLGTLTNNTFSGHEFLTGIDNIRVGIAEHEDRSVYISTPLSVCGAGELGVKSVESRPYIEKGTGQLRFTNVTYDLDQSSELLDDSSLAVGEQTNVWFQGSIEYWIVKQDLTPTGHLARTTTFPMLPLDVERIYHERLVLNEKSDASLVDNDIGTLVMFTTRTDGDIKVYRNGILLEDQTDEAVPTDGWVDISTTADRTPGNGSHMKFVMQVQDRLPGDIFTVSYTPVVSSTNSIPKAISEFTQIGGLNVVDLVGDLSARLCPGNVEVLDRIGEDVEDIDSEIYLVIILRQNTAEPTLTPAVEEYTLVAGCKDSSKFEEV